MAKSHRYQKHAVDEAKLLLASPPTKCSKKLAPLETCRPATHSASALEAELRNWRACFKSWIAAQRSYIGALTGWALRCSRSNDAEKLPFSPRRSGPAPPSFSLCVLWSRLLNRLGEDIVAEGLDFFAAGIGSIYGQMREEAAAATRAARRMSGGGDGREMLAMELGEKARDEEKTAEVAVKVLFAGMSVAVSSLTEFAAVSAEGYEEILKQWEKETREEVNAGA